MSVQFATRCPSLPRSVLKGGEIEGSSTTPVVSSRATGRLLSVRDKFQRNQSLHSYKATGTIRSSRDDEQIIA